MDDDPETHVLPATFAEAEVPITVAEASLNVTPLKATPIPPWALPLVLVTGMIMANAALPRFSNTGVP